MVEKPNPFLDEEQDTPDLTSLIDCVFLLLIFFMVTTAFLSTKGINVTLPGAIEESVATPLVRDLTSSPLTAPSSLAAVIRLTAGA